MGSCTIDVTGTRVPPSPFEPTRIIGNVDHPVTSTLPFRNPSNEMAYIYVTLVQWSDRTAWTPV